MMEADIIAKSAQVVFKKMTASLRIGSLVLVQVHTLVLLATLDQSLCMTSLSMLEINLFTILTN